MAREAYEVIVVDDGSRMPPRDLIARFARSIQIQLVEQANAGPAAARNAGAFAARGAYLAFTDDDCRPSRGWLTAMCAALERHQGAAIGGPVVSCLDNVFSTASQLLVDFLYEYFERTDPKGRFFVTANVAMPTERFRSTGGFDLTFPFAAAEDRDMCERWYDHGYELAYADGAVVLHAHPLVLGSFWRQHFTYGRGAWFLSDANRRRGRQGLRVRPLSFYSALVWSPLVRTSFPRNVVLAGLLVLSQVAYVAGFARQAWSARRVAVSRPARHARG
jgi:GT2 family glycosyltransferase